MKEGHSNGANYRRMTTFYLKFCLGTFLDHYHCTLAQAHEFSGNLEMLQRIKALQAQTNEHLLGNNTCQPEVLILPSDGTIAELSEISIEEVEARGLKDHKIC